MEYKSEEVAKISVNPFSLLRSCFFVSPSVHSTMSLVWGTVFLISVAYFSAAAGQSCVDFRYRLLEATQCKISAVFGAIVKAYGAV